jgi:hypothetical protein
MVLYVQRQPKEQNIGNTDLIQLLHSTGVKKSSIPRDRIFSLLSLCPTEAARIDVDYDISDWALARTVLDALHHRRCVCSLSTILKTLGLPRDLPRGDFCIEYDIPLDVARPFPLAGGKRSSKTKWIEYQCPGCGETLACEEEHDLVLCMGESRHPMNHTYFKQKTPEAGSARILHLNHEVRVDRRRIVVFSQPGLVPAYLTDTTLTLQFSLGLLQLESEWEYSDNPLLSCPFCERGYNQIGELRFV